MSSTIIRGAFIFFILGCIVSAGWSHGEGKEARATTIASETWIPAMCSAWADHVEVEASELDIQAMPASADTSAAAGATADAVYTKCESECTGAHDAPFRR